MSTFPYKLKKNLLICTVKIYLFYSKIYLFVFRYIQETLGLHQLDPMYRQFARIFETFRISEPEKPPDLSKEFAQAQALGAKQPNSSQNLKKVPKLPDEYDEEEVDEIEVSHFFAKFDKNLLIFSCLLHFKSFSKSKD